MLARVSRLFLPLAFGVMLLLFAGCASEEPLPDFLTPYASATPAPPEASSPPEEKKETPAPAPAQAEVAPMRDFASTEKPSEPPAFRETRETGELRPMEEPRRTIPVPSGTITFVNLGVGFVLIDVEGGDLKEGTALKSFAPGVSFENGQESAILKVSAERRRPFVVADIVKGKPSPGDVVYQ